MPLFERVTIVGVGLIGGSLGMALRDRGLAGEVVGVTRAPELIDEARARGAIDRGTVDPAAGVAGADLAVLATPPDLIVPMARRVLPAMRAGALVTDVASVKGEIVRGVEALLPADGRVAFLGGHPMAGNEGRGVTAASATLFEGTAYLLTPTPRTPAGAVERMRSLASGLGAQAVVMDPDEHDRAVAVTSHLPYLLAAALVGISGPARSAAGPSFMSATRVAGSPVQLWAQICRLNREPIRRALRAFCEELSHLEAALADGARLDAMLEHARQARASILRDHSVGARGPSADRQGEPPAEGDPRAGEDRSA
jgi:prephenate dehydrogenase